MGKFSDITGNKYNRLLVLKKTNKKMGTNYLWECQCDCGNITYASKTALESGHKKSCGCLHTEQRTKLGKSKKKDLLNRKFGMLTVIAENSARKDGRVTWNCKCDCGNVIIVSSHELLSNRKNNCGCQIIRSKGEQKIASILKEYNISFEQEKIFPDLKYNGKNLRFDFFIDNQYLIEYDGKQHFIKDSGYGSDLENIQKRDRLKDQYAIKNGIPLIRIKYLDYDKITINDLILNKKEEKTNDT